MQQSWIGGDLRFSYCIEHDLPDISRMLAKESVCRWLFFGPNTDEATRSYFLPLIEETQEALAEGRVPEQHVFTIRLKHSGEFVGQCALLPVDFSPGAFLIGYQLDDTCWRRGYGTLACTFLVYFAFAVLGGYRLNGDTVADNMASRRVMERCGFVQEGVQRRYWHAQEGYYDRVIFGLLASDLAPERLSALGEAFTAESQAIPSPGAVLPCERTMHGGGMIMGRSLLFEEKILEKDGCPIRYRITPDHRGPWLIFLHGAGADHRMFDEQVRALDDSYGVMLWDARGHGQSRPIGDAFSIGLLVDDLLAIMREEAIEKATFIGQSMGGNLAQEVAFYHPGTVENLVLIDCACNTMKLTALEQLVVRMTPLLVALYPGDALTRQSAHASALKPEVQKYLLNTFQTIGPKNFKRVFLETAACLHFEKDYRIDKPLLLVCGDSDNLGNVKKIAPVWAKLEPKCEFHWIPDAGHCSNQDNPEAFNALLLGFLRRRYPDATVDRS